MNEPFRTLKTRIPGCVQVVPVCHPDKRGKFVKLYHQADFPSQYMPQPLAEEFCTVSRRRVLRGLHFQLPPMDVAKLVLCVAGEVLDIVVDLRVGSPTYGQHDSIVLSSSNPAMLYIPSGLAHGFYVTSETAVMLYKANKVYSPESDTGIHWRSAGIPWPDSSPIVSERDSALAPLSDFVSPFQFGGE